MFAGLILSGILAAASQMSPATTAQPPAGTGTPPAALEKAESPYAQLFGAVRPGAAEPESNRQQSPWPGTTGPRKKVVCGMTLLLVGPKADPGLARPAPKDGVAYTMRRVPPPVCGQDR